MGPCDSDGLAFQTKFNIELVGATEGVDVTSARVKLKPGRRSGGSGRLERHPAGDQSGGALGVWHGPDWPRGRNGEDRLDAAGTAYAIHAGERPLDHTGRKGPEEGAVVT